MFDSKDLLIAIKRAAQEALEASKPSDFCFGKVTGVSPLKILIEQKMVLSSAQLILTRNVTDYETKVTIQGEDKKEITIHNKLKNGEQVILLRQKGGQKYLVLDRVVNS